MDYHVENCRVQFFHYRYPAWVDNYVAEYKRGKFSRAELDKAIDMVNATKRYTPSNYGGKTLCLIDVYDEGNVVRTIKGEAMCSPLDRFCRKTGRDIAFGRALKQLKEIDNDRFDLLEVPCV